MILLAHQQFTLRHPGGAGAALAFVRDPARALAAVDFLRGLHADTWQVRGELVVAVPLLGEVDLPFCSQLHVTPDGAELLPQALDQERAWVEVGGVARTDAQGDMAFGFEFRAHLSVPEGGGWGGAAFEKMARSAAERTLERLARTLPASIAAALTQD
ncbi:DUF3809 domain-containing protein [uncultured Deinococcus sp.]|uniref:DUF3809 domain-containing protein n=1 Tax=uncultured Deinococcus sp. TaxID=158789 RepID=UPI003749DC1C